MRAPGPIPIDAARLEERIRALAEVGRRPGAGIDRPVYTEAWVEATRLVERWFRESGLTTWRDAVGNVFGRSEGTERASVVLTGSHIDTVRNGGGYDGALGIHAGLAAVDALTRAYGRPRRPLEVVALCEEEGSRFHADFWGTRAILGRIDPDEPSTLRDEAGVSISEAMSSAGLDPGHIASAKRDDIGAFLELHIEQGPVLEMERRPIAVVTRITGIRQLRVTVRGRQDHAGTTPMDVRVDPVAATARMIIEITRAAAEMGHPAVATVGSIAAVPGATNVVAASTTFTIDTRHSDTRARRQLVDEIEGVLRRVSEQTNTAVEIEILMDQEPVELDRALRELLMESAHQEGHEFLEIPSGAGHDSMEFAKAVPTAMLFVPSAGGRSHTPEEHTALEDMLPGVAVLARSLHALAYLDPPRPIGRL